jgi:ribonuclease BN (tRNA processing enzyme)
VATQANLVSGASGRDHTGTRIDAGKREWPLGVRCRGIAALVTVAAVAFGAQAMAEVAAPSQSLELVVLGSGGPGATRRASSAYLVIVDGQPRILVDAGPGSFARLGESGLSLARVDVVLLTHLHIDHAGELPGLIKARAVAGSGPIHFAVFGPTGRLATTSAPAFPSTSRAIELLFGKAGTFAYLADFAAPVSFHATDIRVDDPDGSTPRTIMADDSIRISAVGGHHGDAPAVIYRIEHGGRSITFSGDIDAHGLPALAAIAQRSNLLVFNAVVLDPPGSPDILYSLHTPPAAIGELAARARVEALLLSHLSPAVDGARAAVTASITRHFTGRLSFAEDLLRLKP